jgi:lipid A 3-O-deacylase
MLFCRINAFERKLIRRTSYHTLSISCMTKPYLLTITLYVLFICACVQPLYAQNTKDQIALTDDNDQYVDPNHDRYYTSGDMLTFTHAISRNKIKDSSIVKKTFEIEGGQRIYTSYTADTFEGPQQNPFVYQEWHEDRPFTGYLFAGFTYNWFYANENTLRFNAEIGTIGPDALGRNVQSGFHKLFGLYPTRGWQWQLNNAAGLNLRLDYKMLLYRTDGNWFDIAFNPDGWLGNTFTGASAGMQFRIGKLNKFFQSAITNGRVSSDKNENAGHEFYFFTVPQINYVAYDATIEGGLGLSDKGPVTFGIYHWVYQQQFGLQYASKRWSASYTAYIRSREVKSTALGDQWGSINVAYRFGRI